MYKLQNAFYQFLLLHADNILYEYLNMKKKKTIGSKILLT